MGSLRQSDCIATYCYVIKGDRYHKVGFTRNVERRLKSLQAGVPMQLYKIHSFNFIGTKPAIKFEKLMLGYLDNHETRTNGEWFIIKNSADFINKMNFLYESKFKKTYEVRNKMNLQPLHRGREFSLHCMRERRIASRLMHEFASPLRSVAVKEISDATGVDRVSIRRLASGRGNSGLTGIESRALVNFAINGVFNEH